LIILISFLLFSGIYAQEADVVPTADKMERVLNESMTTDTVTVIKKKDSKKGTKKAVKKVSKNKKKLKNKKKGGGNQ